MDALLFIAIIRFVLNSWTFPLFSRHLRNASYNCVVFFWTWKQRPRRQRRGWLLSTLSTVSWIKLSQLEGQQDTRVTWKHNHWLGFISVNTRTRNTPENGEGQAQNLIWHLLLLPSWARCIFSTSLSVHIFIRYGLHPTAVRSTVLIPDSRASSSRERSVKACSVDVVLERDDAAWILRRRQSV